MVSHKPRRTAAQIERDRWFVADLYCKGMPQAEIAGRLNSEYYARGAIHPTEVSAMWQSVLAEWRELYLGEVDENKQRELCKLDHLEREAWEAWRRSCSASTKTTTEKSGVPGAGGELGAVKVRKAQVEELRDGDPRFLAQVESCIARRCKILGLDAPTKLEVNSWAELARAAATDLDDLE